VEMPPSSSSLQFETCGGILQPFDDGHVPETFSCKSCPDAAASALPTANPGITTGFSDNGTDFPRIVTYPKHHPEFVTGSNSDNSPDCSKNNDTPSVRVYDNALPPQLLDELYRCTTNGGTKSKPWGTYVAFEEALEWRRKHVGSDGKVHIERMVGTCVDKVGDNDGIEAEQQSHVYSTAATNARIHRHTLAVAVIALLMVDLATNDEDTSEEDTASKRQPTSTIPSNANPPHLLSPSASLLEEAHGVAVWALSSSDGCEVRYHVDYAELLRYEHNITVPPLLAGTVHCTDFYSGSSPLQGEDANNGEKHDGGGHRVKCHMDGGDFAANLGGLGHYEAHGYKGIRSGNDRGGWIDPFVCGANAAPAASPSRIHSKQPFHDEETNWVTIPYCYNRAIFHHGHLPHLSTPIKSISKDSQGEKKSRVILGLNVFGHDVGPAVSQAPEHSDAFRRKVRMYRALLRKSASCSNVDDRSCSGNPQPSNGLSMESVRKNKALSKLLILAKRERIKQDLRERQEQLTKQIWDILEEESCFEQNDDKEGKRRKAVAVGEIMARLGNHNDDQHGSMNGTWPSPTDVQVHLHHMAITFGTGGDGGDSASARLGNDRRIGTVASDRNSILDECGMLLPSAKLYIEEQ